MKVIDRKLLKWIGYPVFAVFFFVICLHLTFPFEKVKYRAEQLAASALDMDVSIGELGPSYFFGVSAEHVLLVIKPKDKKPPYAIASPTLTEDGAAPAPEPEKNKKPMRIIIDDLSAKIGLFSLIFGDISLDFDLQGLGGTIEGDYSQEGKKTWETNLEIEKLDLSHISGLDDFIRLPLAGKLSGTIDLNVPKNLLAESTGSIEIECEGCAVGNGKKKLVVPGNPLLAMGITLPRVRLGKLGGRIKIQKGVATLENITAKSPDIELILEGTMELRKPMGFSNVEAYLRFKISPQLKQRDPKFEMLENAFATAKRPDGFFGLRLTGPLRKIQPIPSSLGPPRDSRSRRLGGPQAKAPAPKSIEVHSRGLKSKT